MGKKSAKSKSKDESEASTKLGLGCLLLFAFPFALVGAGVGVGVLTDLSTWRSAQSWVETPATLLAFHLDEDNSGDSTTYSVTATYTYQFNGREYTSRRVALQDGSDNMGTYHQDRARELEAILKAGGQMSCYVDPAAPARAMLFRDLRPGLLTMKIVFSLVFGGVGFGLLIGGVYGYRRLKYEEEAKKAMPGMPWMWREDWAAGRIRSSDGKAAWGIGIFAAIWNVFCWPVFFLFWNQQRAGGGGPPMLFVAMFPAAGAFIAVWAAYLWLRRLRWGVSEFEMAAVPGVLGGPLAGMIHAPAGIRPEDGFTLRLVCNKTTRGDDSPTQVDALWESEQRIDRDLSTGDGGETLIPVKFLVPYDQPPSGENVTWQLEVKAERVGIDYAATFEAPVFMTAASSPSAASAVRDVERTDAEAEGESSTDDLTKALARMHARLEETMPGSRAIVFPMARNRGMAAFLTLFCAVWTVLCIGLFLSGAPLLVSWVPLLFEVFVLYAAIDACFGSTRLEYSPRGVTYSHRVFGLGRSREIAPSAATSVAVEKSGTKYGDTAYRKIVLRTADGEHKLVSDIARAADAERLAADIHDVLGLEDNRIGGNEMTLETNLPSDFLSERKTS